MTELAGVMMGHYVLQECLGREGMVETYLARSTERDDQDATLRIFYPPFPDPTAFQEHFSFEVRKLWRCQHPHIQPLIEFGEGEGLLYVATRPVVSTTLADLLDRQDTRRFSLAFVTEVITQLCQALQSAHEHGIVHGNLQPASLLLDQNGQIRLTDFSLKQAYCAGDPQLAQLEEGNAAYIAPEQVVGMLAPASDIYALGVLLYRLLTGVLPYDGESAGEIALLHANEPIPALRQLRPDLPEALELVIRIALAKNSATRFATPQIFAQALLKALTENKPPILAVRPTQHLPVHSRRIPLTASRAFSLLALLLIFAGLGSTLYFFSFSSLPMLTIPLIGQQGVPGAIPITLPIIGELNNPTPVPGTGIVSRQDGPANPQGPIAGGKPGQPTPGPQNNPTPAPNPTSPPTSAPVATPTPVIQQSPIVLPVNPTPGPAPLTCVPGSLKLDGSSYLAPLLQQVGNDYQVFCPGLSLAVGSNGSQAGLTALRKGEINLAASDLSVKNPQQLTDYPVAALLYSVIVNPDVQISGLSSAQLKAIYQGQITNWSQIGGPDEAIHIFLHPNGETLKAIFQAFVLNGAAEHVAGTPLSASLSPEQIVQDVAQTPGAITYVPLDVTASANVRVLAINRVLPTTQNLLQGSYAFWSVEHLYALRSSASAQGQSYLQFLQAAPETNRLAQSGAVPFNQLTPPLLAAHLPGPYINGIPTQPLRRPPSPVALPSP